MKSILKTLLLSPEILRLARTNALRFALQGTGALLRASAPLVLRAGEKLQELAEDRPPASWPSPTNPGSSFANGFHPGSYSHEEEDEPSHRQGDRQAPNSFF